MAGGPMDGVARYWARLPSVGGGSGRRGERGAWLQTVPIVPPRGIPSSSAFRRVASKLSASRHLKVLYLSRCAFLVAFVEA